MSSLASVPTVPGALRRSARLVAVMIATALVFSAIAFAISLQIVRIDPNHIGSLTGLTQASSTKMSAEETATRTYVLSASASSQTSAHTLDGDRVRVNASALSLLDPSTELYADLKSMVTAQESWADRWVRPSLARAPTLPPLTNAALTQSLDVDTRLFSTATNAYQVIARRTSYLNADRVRKQQVILSGFAVIEVVLLALLFLALLRQNRVLGNLVVAPLRRLVHTVEEMRGGNLNAHIPVDAGPREIRAISAELLRLRDAIVEFQAKQQMVSDTDGLTRIWNRRRFDTDILAEVARCTRSGTPLTLVLADIDNFKQINDRFGHPIGDEVLRSVVSKLTSRLRISDLAYRYGGEEIAILLPDTKLDDGRSLAEELRQVIAADTFTGPKAVTASFGVAALALCVERTAPAGAAAQLVSHADSALYRAKRAGRNRVCTAD